LHHQGTFYRRANFPGYDLRFKVFADFDVNHSNSGVSSHKLHRTEIFRVIASNFGIVYVPLAWSRARYAGIKIRVARLLAGLGKARISSLRH
jgi:hypothetical protein